jgi:hypothetical protein
LSEKLLILVGFLSVSFAGLSKHSQHPQNQLIMHAKNHPFFFPLLKKLIIVSINECNTNVITKRDKEKIHQLSGISWGYLDKIITKEVYTSSTGQSSIGKPTLNKLIACLPNEWGYGENWSSFRKSVLEKLVDKELIRDTPNKDYDNIFDSNIKKRIKKEVEFIARRCLRKSHYVSIETPIIHIDNNKDIKINTSTPQTKTVCTKTKNLVADGLLMKLLYVL